MAAVIAWTLEHVAVDQAAQFSAVCRDYNNASKPDVSQPEMVEAETIDAETADRDLFAKAWAHGHAGVERESGHPRQRVSGRNADFKQLPGRRQTVDDHR